ncbi:MAG TPA: vitamin K epoxide reductase family protein [Pyrinomonadaceae bacterium]|nr:vitamin K epoxide reductase family protein [Pyrinomonadaceae bacterium]
MAAVLSLAGLADAIYLTVEHLSGRSVRCTVTSGCSEVLASPYATIGGYPLALFGALAYFTAFSLATLAAFGSQRAGNLFAVLVALMFAVSLWLLYLQAFVLHAFCQYCLLSAAITTLLACIAVARRVTK